LTGFCIFDKIRLSFERSLIFLLSHHFWKEDELMKRRIFTLIACLLVASIAILAFDAKVVEAQIIEDGLLIYYSYDADTVKGDIVKDLSGNGHDGLLKTNKLSKFQ